MQLKRKEKGKKKFGYFLNYLEQVRACKSRHEPLQELEVEQNRRTVAECMPNMYVVGCYMVTSCIGSVLTHNQF